MMTTTSFFAMITNAEKQDSNIIELKCGAKLYVNNYVFDINKGEPRIPRNLKIDISLEQKVSLPMYMVWIM